jgi:hypothetical protein
MSNNKGKNKGQGFNNYAAQRFQDMRKIERMSEEEIFNVLEDDFSTVLKQLADNLNHVSKAKYPQYAPLMFNNPSAAKYVLKYVKRFKGELDEDEVLAIRHLLATGYKMSMDSHEKGGYINILDSEVRADMLLEAFRYISKSRIKKARLLKLKDKDKKLKIEEATVLAIYSFLSVETGIRKVIKIIDSSSVSNKRKLEVFKGLYGKRWKQAFGGMLTINTHSDFQIHCIEKFMKMKPKMRKEILKEYATIFKIMKSNTDLITSDDFVKKNKKIIKKLIKSDIGFKKALKPKLAKFQRSDKGKGNYTNNNNNFKKY